MNENRNPLRWLLATLALPVAMAIAAPRFLALAPVAGAAAFPVAMVAIETNDLCWFSCMVSFVTVCLAVSFALDRYGKRR